MTVGANRHLARRLVVALAVLPVWPPLDRILKELLLRSASRETQIMVAESSPMTRTPFPMSSAITTTTPHNLMSPCMTMLNWWQHPRSICWRLWSDNKRRSTSVSSIIENWWNDKDHRPQKRRVSSKWHSRKAIPALHRYWKFIWAHFDWTSALRNTFLTISLIWFSISQTRSEVVPTIPIVTCKRRLLFTHIPGVKTYKRATHDASTISPSLLEKFRQCMAVWSGDWA